MTAEQKRLRVKYKATPDNLRRDVLKWAEERGRSRVLQTVENRGPLGNAAILRIAREYNITPEETRRMIQELLIELR